MTSAFNLPPPLLLMSLMNLVCWLLMELLALARLGHDFCAASTAAACLSVHMYGSFKGHG